MSRPIWPEAWTLGSQISLIWVEAWLIAAMRLWAKPPRPTSIRVMMANPMDAR
ncbi:hypothetical protein D3C76_1718260 [compost metagenome]